MNEALETLHAMRLLAEIKGEKRLVDLLKKDIKALNADITQYKGA